MAAMQHFEWNIVDIGATCRFRALCVVNARVIWLAGMDGSVHRSIDGGDTWSASRPVPAAAGEELELRAIHAFDEAVAVVLAPGPGSAAQLFRTEDGGSSWTLVYRAEDPGIYLDGLAFTGETAGLAVGDPIDGRFTLLASNDAGRSWARVAAHDSPAALPGEGAYAASGSCVVATDGTVRIGTGGAAVSRVLRAAGGTTDWQAFDTPIRSAPMAGVFGLDFTDARHGIAVGGDHGDQEGAGPALAMTGDGGENWRLLDAPAPHGYRSAAVLLRREPGTIVSVGPGGSEISTDAGANWRSLGRAFNTVRTAADGACWAAGDDGLVARLRRAEG